VSALFGFWFLLDVLAIVSMFGFGIALNMIFRQWWVSVLLFVLLSAMLFFRVGFSFSVAEWVLYGISLVGVLLSAFGVMALKKNGYVLFTK
jgi:hypothetical protein